MHFHNFGPDWISFSILRVKTLFLLSLLLNLSVRMSEEEKTCSGSIYYRNVKHYADYPFDY